MFVKQCSSTRGSSTHRMPIDAYQRRTRRLGAQWHQYGFWEHTMQVFKDLFTTDVGIMSAAGIAFMLGMAVFFIRFFLRHMREDEALEKAKKR
jgi:hypothetical protein